jgi:hypothetical protein
MIEYGSSIQGRTQDGAKIEDFKYLSKRKIFLVLTLSLSLLCLRMSKHLSMGEEVGTMQFYSSRGANKKRKEKERKKMSIKKKRNIYIYRTRIFTTLCGEYYLAPTVCPLVTSVNDKITLFWS